MPTSATLAEIEPTTTPLLVVVKPTATPLLIATSVPPTQSTELPSPTFTATAVPQTYIVQPADTLITIALKFDVLLPLLIEVNNLDNPDQLSVGQELTIPTNSGTTNQPEHENNISYQVQAGETFVSIATKFGVAIDTLQRANPDIAPEALQTGSTIQIPWGGVHIVGLGDTLSEIAVRYGVNYDDLVQANNRTLDMTNLDYIQAGWRLTIPFSGVVEEVVDCDPIPPRTGVIGYHIQPGEGLFCLARKFSLSEVTLLNANPHIMGEGRLEAAQAIIVPPSDGAVYIVTEDDVENEITVTDIANWYSVDQKDVTDWEGNVVESPLKKEQRLFLSQADPLADPFNVTRLIAFRQGPPPAPTAPEQDSTPIASAPNTDMTAPPITPPSNGEFTYNRLWMRPISIQDPGHCPLVQGHGWTGSLVWPSDSRHIPENRGFRPGHNGIDIDMAMDSPVYASETGVVIWSGYSSFAGANLVILAHGNGWRTIYNHLQSSLVECGQVVSKGQVIALSGQTGTYWPHLHFEVEHAGSKYDPLNWLP